ncbi:hypothetical protein NNC19_18490 [Clostridium sp. SHJSY1]|uniref:hypothetical protein n=1 Tax=Clostridium sp. SHJSY1 TaxID=2942483 RepID=UPI0028755E67|nr:hypothetical protein [Clostridium sp. SHJSY1]MDS0527682.1 hypothetical protein [Clostridium sp. SHJSY1]
MNKRKVIISILALSILLNLLLAVEIYNKNNKKDLSKVSADKVSVDKLSNSDKENLMGDLYSVKDISEDRKKEIAKNLFEEYINKNSTDWQTVKDKKLNRKPLPTFTDYRITDVFFIKESGNKFTVDIIYDIQYTDEGKQWVAGDGELAENNWVLKKDFLLDIIKYNDKYMLSQVYH